jgi:Uma2 family endonuclease
MRATAAPSEQRVLLRSVSWDTYERLLAENIDSPGTRFTYDEGMLEIMVVSAGHENPNRRLASLAEIVAEETGRDFQPFGSTTFKHKDLEKGFEPDSCFYFTNAAAVRDADELDLATDPPPELVIEIDITRSSLNRFAIFAAVGVQEIWRYEGERVTMYRLAGSQYEAIETSVCLPPLTARQATEFLKESRTENAVVWLRRVRRWVRDNIAK